MPSSSLPLHSYAWFTWRLRRSEEQLDGQSGQLDEQSEGWLDGWSDEWSGWVEGQSDGWSGRLDEWSGWCGRKGIKKGSQMGGQGSQMSGQGGWKGGRKGSQMGGKGGWKSGQGGLMGSQGGQMSGQGGPMGGWGGQCCVGHQSTSNEIALFTPHFQVAFQTRLNCFRDVMTPHFASRKQQKLEHTKFARVVTAALNKRWALNKTAMYKQTAYTTFSPH